MASPKDELRTRLLAIFREEASDHLRSIAGEMARLDADEREDAALATVNGLFRTVHTLKGAARSLSIRDIEQACHEIEDLCSALTGRRVALDGQTRAILHELTDDLAAITTQSLADIEAPSAPSAPSPDTSPAPASSDGRRRRTARAVPEPRRRR